MQQELKVNIHTADSISNSKSGAKYKMWLESEKRHIPSSKDVICNIAAGTYGMDAKTNGCEC